MNGKAPSVNGKTPQAGPDGAEAKLPQHPLDIGGMSKEQLDAELEKGYADMQAGRVISAKKARIGT